MMGTMQITVAKEKSFLTLKERLEQIIEERGHRSLLDFAKSLGYSYNNSFKVNLSSIMSHITACRADVRYIPFCDFAQRLGLVPLKIFDMRGEFIFGRSEQAFRKPIDYEYIKYEYLGNVIRVSKKIKGLTRYYLDVAAGQGGTTHVGFVARCERGEGGVELGTLTALCKKLDLRIEWLAEPDN